MPSRMKLDLVDAVPEAVVRAEHRRIAIRLLSRLEGLASDPLPEPTHAVLGGGSAFAVERLGKDAVGVVEIVAFEQRGLIQNLVRGRHDAIQSAGFTRVKA